MVPRLPTSTLFPYTTLFRSEDGGQHARWKPADGLTDADIVFVFRRTGVLDDHYRHVGRAAVLEVVEGTLGRENDVVEDRKSTRLNSSHMSISYAVFCLKKKN